MERDLEKEARDLVKEKAEDAKGIVKMASRTYDRVLKCGCMISSDGGGGLIPCFCEYTKDKKERERLMKIHEEAWDEWRKSEDYKQFLKEVKELNT